jgi:CHAT domain-containing protein/tetratricopeptide (TPR) repeat protein
VGKNRAKKDFGPQNRIDKEKLVLTRPSDKHLDDAELDALVLQSPDQGANTGWLTKSVIVDVQRHVESCRECSLKVQMHKSAQNEIARLGGPRNVAPGPECVADVEWFRVAAGLLPETKTRELMKHAAQCGHCGPLLRNATDTLSEEVTSNEERMLASLSSSRPEWQKGMAQTLHGSTQDRMLRKDSTSAWPGWFSWPRQAFALAALAVVIVALWLGSRVYRPPVEQLLAQAYTERRTLEVRIPGAKYAPLRVELGKGVSNLDKPPSLLRAEALIGENLGRHPDDPDWLEARGRADLLDGNYDSAIDSLQRAIDLRPDFLSARIDLASAYCQRGAANADRQVDYGTAIEHLGRVLAKSPNDSTALFNRAIAEEKFHLYDPAIADWQRYLKVEPNDAWAEEARKRLEEVQEKVRSKQSSLAKPLLTVDNLASIIGSPTVSEELDARIEDYLHIATRNWLPQAFPNAANPLESQKAQTVLRSLAVVSLERHQDSWLSDLLDGSHGHGFAHAVAALAVAVNADDNGDYAAAQASAREASRLFRVADSFSGEVRAIAEEMYADHLLYDGRQCISLLKRMNARFQNHTYEWIRAQTTLEASNCFDLVGNPGLAQKALDRGTREAVKHGYSGLFLRGLGFQADLAAYLGDTQNGFAIASRGLDLFWSSQIGAMKGYNLYTDLDTAADVLHLPYLQVALWRQATSLIEMHPDVVQRAMAHRWYANSAYLANLPDLAGQEFAKASVLFGSAPATQATARGQLEADIWLARLEVRQGDLDRAASDLERVRANLERSPSFPSEIGFYTTKADLSLRQGDLGNAGSAIRSAVFLAEWALRSFPRSRARRQWTEQTASAYRDLVAWKLQQKDASGALEFWEWYTGAEFRIADAHPDASDNLEFAVPPDLRDAPLLVTPTIVAQQLPLIRQETVVVYAMLPEGTAVWVYDDRGIASQWIAIPATDLEEQAIQFQHLCSTRDTSIVALRSAARRLYDLLIGPIEGRLVPGRRLVFELDGVLSAIPFDALVDRQGHYLAERSSIAVTPGLYETLRLQPVSSITAETPALVVSVSAPFAEAIPPAPDTEREAQVVSNGFHSPEWLNGSAATLAAVRNGLRRAQLFHFAGHAVALPERNGLLLAERDSLTQQARLVNADSIDPSLLQGLQLAVLSACSTGTPLSPGASGTESLSQSLLRSGVPNVVATRWNVDSAITLLFMKQFYGRLLNGDDVGDSLHSAEMALASQSALAHPYYWAAFELRGNAMRLSEE